MRNIAVVTGGKPIAFWSHLSQVSAVNPLVAFYDVQNERGAILFFLSRTPHETYKCGIKLINLFECMHEIYWNII
jgi:hypothetical protein